MNTNKPRQIYNGNTSNKCNRWISNSKRPIVGMRTLSARKKKKKPGTRWKNGKLWRELHTRQQQIEKQTADLKHGACKRQCLGEQQSELLSAERGRFQKNLAIQVQKWKKYSESTTEDAEDAPRSTTAKHNEAEKNWSLLFWSHTRTRWIGKMGCMVCIPLSSSRGFWRGTIGGTSGLPRFRSFVEPRTRGAEGGMDGRRHNNCYNLLRW